MSLCDKFNNCHEKYYILCDTYVCLMMQYFSYSLIGRLFANFYLFNSIAELREKKSSLASRLFVWS